MFQKSFSELEIDKLLESSVLILWTRYYHDWLNVGIDFWTAC